MRCVYTVWDVNAAWEALDESINYLHKDDSRKVRFFLHHKHCHVVEDG